jgi:hypothetical protein
VGSLRYVERDQDADHLVSQTSGLRVAREELFDLSSDPGERHDLSRERPDDVAKMRERLANALSTSTASDARGSAALAGSRHQPANLGPPSKVTLRFAGGGAVHRITLTARVPEPEPGALPATISGKAIELDPAVLRIEGRRLDAAFLTEPDGIVGIELDVSPASARVTWEVRIDDQLASESSFFAGPYGLSAARLAHGVVDAETTRLAETRELPTLDPRRDFGIFVSRDPGTEAAAAIDETSEAAGEMKRLLESWGYAKTK